MARNRESVQPADSAKLATAFHCDHFKLVASYGGEKDYE